LPVFRTATAVVTIFGPVSILFTERRHSDTSQITLRAPSSQGSTQRGQTPPNSNRLIGTWIPRAVASDNSPPHQPADLPTPTRVLAWSYHGFAPPVSSGSAKRPRYLEQWNGNYGQASGPEAKLANSSTGEEGKWRQRHPHLR
jgi:hypothetical protein